MVDCCGVSYAGIDYEEDWAPNGPLQRTKLGYGVHSCEVSYAGIHYEEGGIA